jgi:DHA1 family tetracycline resistance protein-like MFS transporter
VPSSRKPSLGAIFLTIFLDLVGFGMVLPFLAEEARDTFHQTALVGSLLGAAYSLMGFFFIPVWGQLSDRVGRRPILVASVLATAISNLGLGVALAYGTSVWWLFAMRIFAGIATANISTASAYITDVTKPEDRAKGMGLIGMAFGMGFILGPGFGGVLASIELNHRHGPLACFAAGTLSVLNLVWVVFGLPESLPKEKRNARPTSRSRLDFAALRKTFADPMLGRAVIVNLVAVTAFANLDQTYRYFNKDEFTMTERETGVLLAIIGVAAAAVQGGLVRRLSGKVQDSAMLRWGIALQVVAFSLTAASPSVGRWSLYVAGIILAFGNGLAQPAVASFVSKRAAENERGAILGTNQSASSLGRVLGPAMGGWLYGSLFGPSAPFWAGAIGMLLALGFAWSLRDGQSTSTQAS